MLTSAVEHYRTQQRITAAALTQLRRARFGPLDTLTRTMLAYQVIAAREATAAVPRMLEEQNLDAPLAARPRPEALAGYASDGRTMSGLLDYTRSQDVTDLAFSLIVATQLQDVARQAESVSIAARPAVTGYVRMLNAPSCSRCAILAGRFYKWSDGFQRHPRCDCRHVPTTKPNAGGLVTEPRAYFDSLAGPEQDRIFTKAGAQAIRDGADMSRVVNARRGMSTAQPRVLASTSAPQTVMVAGKPAFKVYEPPSLTEIPGGTRLARDASGSFTTVEGMARSGGTRLMPESIYEIAGGDRIEALRLLRANGYLA